MDPKHWTLRENEENVLHEAILGQGGSGEVHRMFNSKTQQPFARKLIRPFSGILKQDIENEVRALDKLCTSMHPNIVQVEGHGKLKEDGAFFYIDMELCDVTLERYIRGEQVKDLVNWKIIIQNNKVQPHAYNIMRDILRGLLYIHSLGEVHRDLNPRNILLKEKQWKIADFGLASAATSNRLVTTRVSRGTSSYRAPELLRSSQAGFNNKTDIWSLGCIGYELLTDQKAFTDDFEVFQYFTSKKSPKQYFKRLDQFSKFYIHDLLEPNPDRRPSAKELVDTKFKDDLPKEVDDEEVVPKRNPFINQIQPTHELISAHRYRGLFVSPVRELKAPGYYSLIFKPTDLETIWKQVKQEVITDGIVFHREIARIYANAIMFNAEDSDVSLAARDMAIHANRYCEKFRRDQNVAQKKL